jgi:hypothetical protein
MAVNARAEIVKFDGDSLSPQSLIINTMMSFTGVYYNWMLLNRLYPVKRHILNLLNTLICTISFIRKIYSWEEFL